MFGCMKFDDWFNYNLFFETIMRKSKQKCKSTREPPLLANSREARKRSKQDVVHRMVMASLDRKTRGDVYIDDKKPLMMPFLFAHG